MPCLFVFKFWGRLSCNPRWPRTSPGAEMTWCSCFHLQGAGITVYLCAQPRDTERTPCDKRRRRSDTSSTSQELTNDCGSLVRKAKDRFLSRALRESGHAATQQWRTCLYYLKPSTLKHFVGKPWQANTRTDYACVSSYANIGSEEASTWCAVVKWRVVTTPVTWQHHTVAIMMFIGERPALSCLCSFLIP